MPHFDMLDGHEYMLLTTFRKDGTPVPTPVWFATDGDRLVVTTGKDSGKVKRIRFSSAAVTVEPCTARGQSLGPQAEATARVLPPGPQSDAADQLLNRKYGIKKKLFQLMTRLTSGAGESAFLEITPR